jgi:hypothetical protein
VGSNDDRLSDRNGRAGEIARLDLEAGFRACMMKLCLSTAGLGQLPEDCTYTMAVEMKHDGTLESVGYPPYIRKSIS